MLADRKGFMIANLVAYFVMREKAAQFGMTGEMLAKNDLVIDGALRSLEICKADGVPVGYGSDLLRTDPDLTALRAHPRFARLR